MSGDHVLVTPPRGKVDATVFMPGSKSFTNRALVAAALARGTSTLLSYSPSRDSDALRAALARLGVTTEPARGATLVHGNSPGAAAAAALVHGNSDRDAAGSARLVHGNNQGEGGGLLVHGNGGRLGPYRGEIDVGPAGTTARFLTALLAGAPGCEVTLRGSERLHERPIGDLVEALRSAGAVIEYEGRPGCPPLRIHGRRLGAGGPVSVTVPGDTSSQFLTALVLASPLFGEGLRIDVTGALTSRSYVDMTAAVATAFGLPLRREGDSFVTPPGACYRNAAYRVEGDATGATYWWGLAALSGGTVRTENISRDSLQGDLRFPEILAEMGCTTASGGGEDGPPWVSVTGGPLRGVEADMSLLPDAAQTLAVVAACAEGDTDIRGLHTLRVKETDRVAAAARELGRFGVRTTVYRDRLVVHGRGARVLRESAGAAGVVATYDDHRMAMAFALLGAVTGGVRLADPDVVAKSYPSFWEHLAACGLGVVRTTSGQ